MVALKYPTATEEGILCRRITLTARQVDDQSKDRQNSVRLSSLSQSEKSKYCLTLTLSNPSAWARYG
jgi:hypothetical protein